MNGICPICGSSFPLTKEVVSDRSALVLISHDDERGNCSGSGKKPKDWPAKVPYQVSERDSGGFGGGLSGF